MDLDYLQSSSATEGSYIDRSSNSQTEATYHAAGDSSNNSPSGYLEQVDSEIDQVYGSSSQRYGADLVSTVFGNQASEHQLKSRQLASLIEERREIAERQLLDVKDSLVELNEQKPLPLRYPINPQQTHQRWNQVQRQIIDLEKQKHNIEQMLWRDTLDLRQAVLNERQEYQSTKRRVAFLAGGDYAAA